MLVFISFLKSIATCLITNSHYTGVYPVEMLANGGLLGNILFFAVSGYCLTNVNRNFCSWYGKRLYRIYPPLFLITTFYVCTGFYVIDTHNLVWWYVYPTYYEFLSALLILYIPYYSCMRYRKLKDNIALIMIAVFVCYIVMFYTFFDRSYYHIDDVSSVMIYFLYFESLLFGAFIKIKDISLKLKWYHLLLFLMAFFSYFGSKLLFVKYQSLSCVQWLNQVAIFVLMALIFVYAKSADKKLESLPAFLKLVFDKLGDLTLDIYLVQFPILVLLRTRYQFPINWILLTTSILMSAVLFHMICKWLYQGLDNVLRKKG